jgi:methyl coenzyme M reductase subunit C-like uncharacterized protein (methanogenesis marker protein 7)
MVMAKFASSNLWHEHCDISPELRRFGAAAQ